MMRFPTFPGLLALLPLSLPLAAQPGGANAALIAPHLSAAPGQTVTVPILLDNSLGDIQGWSFGLEVAAPLELLSAASGATTAGFNGGAGPDFLGPAVYPGSGFTVGVVISFFGTEVLPIGTGYELHELQVKVPAGAVPGTVYPLSFVETLGSPPVANVLVVGGQSFPPIEMDGSITVGFPSFCSCDGSGLVAPCGNFGAPGQGCGNSANASGALLTASGTPSVSSSSIVLETTGGVPGVFGVFFQGTVQAGGGVGTPFNDGFLCAGGTIKRLEVIGLDAAGAAASTVDVALEGLLPPGGGTRTYQFWYRDPQSSPCNTAANTSNGIEIVWVP